jgi:hypothetical protein
MNAAWWQSTDKLPWIMDGDSMVWRLKLGSWRHAMAEERRVVTKMSE